MITILKTNGEVETITKNFINKFEFSFREDIKHIEIYDVYSIDFGAFAHCLNLESILLRRVNGIILGAFSNCSNIKTVDCDNIDILPENLKHLCTNTDTYVLKELDIINDNTLDHFQSIRSSKFDRADVFNNSISKLIENGVLDLSEYNIKYLPYGAISENKDIRVVKLPYVLESIETHALSSCPYLEQVFIPTSLHTIGDRAFCTNARLRSVKLYDKQFNKRFDCSLYRSEVGRGEYGIIGEDAFAECSNLLDVDIPPLILSIDNTALPYSYIGNVKNLLARKEILDEDIEDSVNLYKALQDNDIYVEFRSKVDKEGVLDLSDEYISEIKSYMFSRLYNVRKVILPDSVEVIEHKAFKDCVNLTSVVLSKNITKIERNSFLNCNDKLQFVNLDELYNLEYLDPIITGNIGTDAAIYRRYLLRMGERKLDESFFVTDKNISEHIKNYKILHKNCFSIRDTKSKLTTIPPYSFVGRDIGWYLDELLENVKIIGYGAFYNSEFYTRYLDINFSEKLESVEKFAFKGVDAIRSVSFPENFTGLAVDAFIGCNSIEEINIGENFNYRFDRSYCDNFDFFIDEDKLIVNGVSVDIK